MGAKKSYVVVSFHTTNDAMAVADVAGTAGLSGRLAPIPRQISAGCGLAWIEPAENQSRIVDLVRQNDLEYAGIDLLDL